MIIHFNLTVEVQYPDCLSVSSRHEHVLAAEAGGADGEGGAVGYDVHHHRVVLETEKGIRSINTSSLGQRQYTE